MKLKKILLLLTIAAFAACKSDNTTEEKTTVAAEEINLTNEQAAELIKKDSIINSFSDSYIEIQNNLDLIKSREKMLTSDVKDIELQKNPKDKILEDLKMITDLMQKNKDRIASLNKKLKDANLKDQGLQKLIERLNYELLQKDSQIVELKNSLAASNDAFNQVFAEYQDALGKVFETTDKMNTAYYAYGTSKELTKNGVITKDGGFIGIGKNKKLADNFNKEYFTKINIKDVTRIPLACKRAKVLTNHPLDSYKFVGTKGIEAIEILNEDDFWASSKYLVIIVE